MGNRVVKIRTRNDQFQLLEALTRSRDKRRRRGEFLVEGVRSINAALSYGWEIRAWLYPAAKRLSRWAQTTIERAPSAVRFAVHPELLAEISPKENTGELLAVAACRPDDAARLAVGPGMLVVLFDSPGSPGNLGSALRSCDAFGATGVIVTGHAVDIYEPRVLRAATGSFFALPVLRWSRPSAVLAWCAQLRQQGVSVQLVGSDEDGDTPFDAVDFTQPTLLLLGNESRGLARAYRESVSVLARIPMSGSASSLNVSCAATLLLYESFRQRRKPA